MVNAPTLYYDGPCHLCQRSVQWVRRRMPEVECVPLQSEEAHSVRLLNGPRPRFSGSSSSMAMVKSMWDTRGSMPGVAAKGPWRWLLPCAWLLRSWRYQTHLGPGRRLLGGLTLCDLGGSVISKAGGTFATMNALSNGSVSRGLGTWLDPSLD